jgi:hypothetical protein
MGEDAGTEERQLKNTRASTVIIDVWFPYPWEGWQLGGSQSKGRVRSRVAGAVLGLSWDEAI